MRVLVTGVSGFSGSHIARALAAAGHAVTGLYRRESAFLARARTQPGLSFLKTGLEDAGAAPGSFEAIIHIAATSPAPGITDEMIVRDNLDGTRSLLAAASRWGTQRVVFFSSLSLYGDIHAAVVDENTPATNPDTYGVTKKQCEVLLAESGIPALSLRLPGVLGPGAHRNWLSGVARTLCAGEPIKAFHLDAPFNNAAHIGDIAKLVTASLARDWTGFDAVVLGARGTISVREAIGRLAAGLGVPARIEAITAAKPSFILSSQHAMRRWGYDPMETGAMIDLYAAEVRT